MKMTSIPIPLRLSGRRGLLAAIPTTLGFHPQDSLVMVCLSGPRRRLGPVIRVDLAAFQHGAAPSLHLQLRRHARQHADEVALFCFAGEDFDRAGLSGSPPLPAVLASLIAAGISVLDAVYVHGDRLRAAPGFSSSEDEDEEQNQPVRGPGGGDPQVQALAAATALTGRAVLANRQAVRWSIAGPSGAAAAEASAALHAAADALLGVVGRSGPVDSRRMRQIAADTVSRALARAGESGGVEAPICAMLALLLCDVEVRDIVIGRTVKEPDAPWLPMLIAVARSIPDEEAAEVCAVLSIAAYCRGDGPLAQVAVDRCLTAEPDHRLAHLMLSAMTSALLPEQLGEMISRLVLRSGTA